jgi:hypothetical protein
MELPFDIQQLVLWSGAVSLGALAATVIGVPWVVARLPANYFSRSHREVWRDIDGEPRFALVLGLLKNLLGACLVLLGLLMFFTPGQGVLTLLAGLLLMNFPGKYRVECWLVQQPGVLRGMNWLRARQGQPPFEAPGP